MKGSSLLRERPPSEGEMRRVCQASACRSHRESGLGGISDDRRDFTSLLECIPDEFNAWLQQTVTHLRAVRRH